MQLSQVDQALSRNPDLIKRDLTPEVAAMWDAVADEMRRAEDRSAVAFEEHKKSIDSYDADIQNLIVAITLELFYSQMQNSQSSLADKDFRQLTRFILVDEADNFMSQNFPALKRILKEGREFGVGTILSTQSLRHFGSGDGDYSSYILSWVVHNVSDLKRSDVDFVFKTSSDPATAEMLYQGIKSIGKHQSVIKAGNAAPVTVQDTPFWQIAEDTAESYLPESEVPEEPEV